MEALTCFEELGIVYCDLKPQNILLQYYMEDGYSKLKLVISDFGGAYFRSEGDQKYGNIYTKFFRKNFLFMKK